MAPSNIPDGVPRNSIQFTIEDLFVPRPDSNKHTRKLMNIAMNVMALALVKGIREPHEVRKKYFALGGNRTHDLRVKPTTSM